MSSSEAFDIIIQNAKQEFKEDRETFPDFKEHWDDTTDDFVAWFATEYLENLQFNAHYE